MCKTRAVYLNDKNQLTSWSRVLPEKLTGPKQVIKFPAFYGERKIHYRIHNSPLPVPVPSRIDLSSPRSILIVFSHLCFGLSSGPIPSGFPTKALYAPLLSPYVLHILPISIVLTWLSEWYMVRSNKHKAFCNVIFSTPLLPHSS